MFISVKEEPGVREGGIVDNGNNHISDGILSEGRFSDDEDDDSMGKNMLVTVVYYYCTLFFLLV